MPNSYDGDVEKALLYKGGRMVEHLKCAQIDENLWVVHPGNLLCEKELSVAEAKEEVAKKYRTNAGEGRGLEVWRKLYHDFEWVLRPSVGCQVY